MRLKATNRNGDGKAEKGDFMESFSEMVVNKIFANNGILSPAPETVAGVRKVVEYLVGTTANPKRSWDTDFGKCFLLGVDDSFWMKKSGESFHKVFEKVDSIRSHFDAFGDHHCGDMHMVKSKNRYLFFRQNKRNYDPNNETSIPPNINPLAINLGVTTEGKYVTWDGNPLSENLQKPIGTTINFCISPDALIIIPTTEGFRSVYQTEGTLCDSPLASLEGLDANSLEYFSCRPLLTPYIDGYDRSAPTKTPSRKQHNKETPLLSMDDDWGLLSYSESLPQVVLARTKTGESYYAVIDTNEDSSYKVPSGWQKLPGGDAFVVEGKFKGQPLQIREKANGDLEISYAGHVKPLGNGHLNQVTKIAENDSFQSIRTVIYDSQDEVETQILEINLFGDGSMVVKSLPTPGSDFIGAGTSPDKNNQDSDRNKQIAEAEASNIAFRLTNWPYKYRDMLHPIFGASCLTEEDIPIVARIWDRWSHLHDNTIEKKVKLFMGLLPLNGNNLARTTQLVEKANSSKKSVKRPRESSLGMQLAIETLDSWNLPMQKVEEKYLKQLSKDFEEAVAGISKVHFAWTTKSISTNSGSYWENYCKSWVLDTDMNLWAMRYLDTPKLQAENLKIMHVSGQAALLVDHNHQHYLLDIETGSFNPLPSERHWLAGNIYCEKGIYVTPQGDPYLLAEETIAVPKNLNFCPSYSDELRIVPDASGKMLLLNADLSAEFLGVKIDIESTTDYTPVAKVKTSKKSQKTTDNSASPVTHWIYVRDDFGKIRFFNYSAGKLKLEASFDLDSDSSSVLALKKYKGLTLEFSRTEGLLAKIKSQTKPLRLAPPQSQVRNLLVTGKHIAVTYQGTDGKARKNLLTHTQGHYYYKRCEDTRNIFLDPEFNWEENVRTSPRLDELTMDEIFSSLSKSEYKGFHRAILASLTPTEHEIFMRFAKQMRATPTPYQHSNKNASPWAHAQRLTEDNQPSVWDSCYKSWVLFYNCLYLANWNLATALDAVTSFVQGPAVSSGTFSESEIFADAARKTIWDMPDVPQNWL